MNLDLCRSGHPDESGQSTQSVWFKVPNPRWTMGEETSPLRLRTVLCRCHHALATWVSMMSITMSRRYK